MKLTSALNQDTLVLLVTSNKCREWVAALAVMPGLTIPMVGEAMASASADPILILAKAATLSWPGAQVVLALHARRPLAPQTLDGYRATYHSLSTRAAWRVTRFYKVRHIVSGVPREEAISLECNNTNGGGSRPLVPVADFREITDFRNENLRASTAPRVSIRGRWYKSENETVR